jgi:hypothetical protein
MSRSRLLALRSVPNGGSIERAVRFIDIRAVLFIGEKDS